MSPTPEPDSTSPAAVPAWALRATGDPASAIYGTIVTAALLASQGDSLGTAGVLEALGVTLLVFWAAHSYTDVVGSRLAGDGGFDRAAWRHALRVQWPIVESGLPPAIALLIAVAAGARLDAAVNIALAVAVAELFGWALLAARRMQLPARQAVPYVLLSGLLGLAVVALKAVTH